MTPPRPGHVPGGPPRRRVRRLLLVVGLAAAAALAGGRRTAAAQGAEAPEPPLTVASVRFSGHEVFSDDVLRLRVRTRANRRFLGIPGFTWWRWLYELGLESSGEPPATFDPTVLAADVERLRLFYEQEGFREADVRADVDTTGRRVRVTFRIAPGTPTYVRQVRYEGLDGLTPAQQRRLARGSLLQPRAVDPQTPLVFTARSRRFSEPLLLEERQRLLGQLRAFGYAAVTRDSVRAVVYPERPDSFDVAFRVRPGPRYRFGAVRFDVTGPHDDAPVRRDTLATDPPVTVRIDDERVLDADLLARTLRAVPGAWYDETALRATKRRLEATGVFGFTDLVRLPADTVGGVLYLPHRVELRTRPRHQLRLETFMLQRSGALADADTELGAGLGVTYANLNLFGRGEAFRLRTTGSLAADIDAGLFTSAQWEVAASLTYPYLNRPFRRLDRALGLYDARTQLSVSLLAARRSALRLVIRGRGAARYRLEMQHAPTVTSFVDLLDLSLSNPDTLDGFQEAFLDDLLGSVEDPVVRAQILEDYTRPQVNNALRYTLRSADVDPLRRDRGYSYETAFEVGGNLPYLLDRLVFSPGTLEGSLPSLPIFQGDREASPRLFYRQYARLVGDARRYARLGRGRVLATKAVVGLAHPTGRSDVVPFDRRFYSGGASSVRGWRLRELGPGDLVRGAADSTAGESTNLLGGDIKLEASVELRQTMLRNVLVADWIVAMFADAGNVWLGPRNPGDPDGRFRAGSFYREVGVGGGIGLRLAWDYLIVRLDLGYKVYDPLQPGEGLFPEALRNPLLHFGIGHAF